MEADFHDSSKSGDSVLPSHRGWKDSVEANRLVAMTISEEYLEAPGRIAVIGDDPLTLELAIYGRFLGFDVRVFAPAAIGSAFSGQSDLSLPLMPDRALSPLASSALRAQREEFAGQALPTTVGGWINDALLPLAETDLLRGRVLQDVSIAGCSLVSAEADDNAESNETDDVDEVIEDYAIDYSISGSEPERWVAEAVVVYGKHYAEHFDPTMPYIRRWECCDLAKLELSLVEGYSVIVDQFAQWTERPDLDLYKTRWRS